MGSLAKVGGIVGALGRHPGDLPRYLTHGLRPTDSAAAMGLPWISFSAIRFLENRLRGDETVYEYGCGGSTVFFARRCKRVVSIENDQRWLDELRTRLRAEGLTNVELIHAEADFADASTFGSSEFARALPDKPADIVMVDSYDVVPPHPLRPLLFARAERLVRRPGGMIILDDSWRYKNLRVKNSARQVRTESGLGPARKTATSTDFYLY